MSKLKEKLERCTAVNLVMRGGGEKMLTETDRCALIHATSGHLQNWEKRCVALYQVISSMASGVPYTPQDVANALDVAVGRGDLEKLLPWPNNATSTTVPQKGD